MPVVTIQKSPQGESVKDFVENDGFWVEISLTDIRSQMRIDGTVTHARLMGTVIEAMISVNQALKSFKEKAKSMGYQTIQELHSEEIAGSSIFIHRYKRAVYCLATANLYERYQSFDLTKEGEKTASLMESSIDDLKRDAQNAIRDILGEHRTVVELI